MQTLSVVVRGIQAMARELPPSSRGARTLALRGWGRDSPMSIEDGHGERICRLALAMQRIVVYQLRPPVADLVRTADLHSMPSEAPIMLRGAGIIEVRRPEIEALFETPYGRIVGLGWYHDPRGIMIVARLSSDSLAGVQSCPFAPSWTGEDFNNTLPPPKEEDRSDFEVRVSLGLDWLPIAARFLIIFAMLLECENRPVTEKPEILRIKPHSASKLKEKQWVVRHIYLVETPRPKTPVATHGASSPPTGGMEAFVMVRGHIKRQRHGPNNSLIMWIWVDSYEARRWISEAPKRFVVH